jgi:alpha-beta hydrolase superfamily lysophospholipase
MPFFDTEHGSVYYRHWAAAEPRAAVIFLHGFGEHSGLYHRLGFTLNAAGIDLWGPDQLGHGQTPGPRGDFGSTEIRWSLPGIRSVPRRPRGACSINRADTGPG